MNPIPHSSNPAQPAAEVWPPPPSYAPPDGQAAPIAPVEIFQVKSVWLVLLLEFVTLGLYPVFWLRRQLGIIRAVRPDLVSSLIYANIVLAGWFFFMALSFMAGFQGSHTLNTTADIVGRVFAIMVLWLEFQMRNAANLMMRHDSRRQYWYSAVFTWLLGVVYLQYKINKNIARWRADPSNRAAGS